jgi:hypothetical protein
MKFAGTLVKTLAIVMIPALAGCFGDAGLSDVQKIPAEGDPCGIYICTGDFVDGVKWHDARGGNAFVVSRQVVESEDHVERFSLNVARMILVRPDDARANWQSSHVARDQCGTGIGLIGDIEVTDLDQNGIGEVSYLCSVEEPCDSTLPSVDMVIHAGTNVYEAQAVPSMDSDSTESPELHFELEYGHSLKTGPEVFRAYADSLWQARRPLVQSRLMASDQ